MDLLCLVYLVSHSCNYTFSAANLKNRTGSFAEKARGEIQLLAFEEIIADATQAELGDTMSQRVTCEVDSNGRISIDYAPPTANADSLKTLEKISRNYFPIESLENPLNKLIIPKPNLNPESRHIIPKPNLHPEEIETRAPEASSRLSPKEEELVDSIALAKKEVANGADLNFIKGSEERLFEKFCGKNDPDKSLDDTDS